jgi:hypothetical protein
MIFLNRFGRGLYNEGEGGVRILLPNGEVVRGNDQPAKREKVPARFGNSPNLCPSDLVHFGIDHVARPVDSKEKEGRSPLSWSVAAIAPAISIGIASSAHAVAITSADAVAAISDDRSGADATVRTANQRNALHICDWGKRGNRHGRCRSGR